MPQNKFRAGTTWFLSVKIRKGIPHNTNELNLILGLWLGVSRLSKMSVKMTA